MNFPCNVTLIFENKIGGEITKTKLINDLNDFQNFLNDSRKYIEKEFQSLRFKHQNVIVGDLYHNLTSISFE